MTRYRSIWVALFGVVLLLMAGLFPVGGLSSPASRQQLLLSLELAFGSALIAIIIALPLAVILTRVQIWGRNFAWLMIALLLLAPLYVQLAGWDAFGGWLGWFGRSAPQAWLSGIAAATWVHGVAAIPWATVLIAAGLAQVPRREEELALLESPPLVIFTRVLLPRIAPWIVVAGCLAAVTSWQDMTVTNVYLVPTVTEGIYNRIAHSADAVNAAVYMLPALVVLAGLFCMAAVVSQRLLQADFPTSSREPIRWPMDCHRLLLSALVWSLLLLLAGVPLLVLVRQAGLQLRLDGNEITRHWDPLTMYRSLARTIEMMHQDFLWTMLTAAAAASFSLIIVTVVAWWARGGGWRLYVITMLATFLLAIPGPLVGVSIIGLLNQPAVPGFTYLYDRTIVPPALAQAARALPLALFIVWHGLARFDRQQQEAAALDGCGDWEILWRIVLPQRWRAVFAAWGFAFAVGLGDVSCSLLVIPPGMDTVQRRLFGMIHSGVDDQVAAACLLLMALAFVGALIVLLSSRLVLVQKSRD